MNLVVRYDDRIRLTASALLLTKFVHENTEFKWHPLKVQTLRYIEHLKDHPFIVLVNELSTRHWMNDFYSIAVLVNWSGSRFLLPDSVYNQMPHLRSGQYTELMTQFYADSKLNFLWRENSEEW